MAGAGEHEARRPEWSAAGLPAAAPGGVAGAPWGALRSLATRLLGKGDGGSRAVASEAIGLGGEPRARDEFMTGCCA